MLRAYGSGGGKVRRSGRGAGNGGSGGSSLPISVSQWNTAVSDTHLTYSNNDTTVALSGWANPAYARSFIAYASGDRYMEFLCNLGAVTTGKGIGLCLSTFALTGAELAGVGSTSAYWRDHGYVMRNGAYFISIGAAAELVPNGVIAGIRYDGTTLTIYKNGTSVGSGALPNGAWYPLAGQNNGQSGDVTLNCGSSPFSYQPSGTIAWGA